MIDYLLQYNLIPGSIISDESKERLKCEFLNKEYYYPIGLNIGIDCIGNVKSIFKLNKNLEKFKFIKIRI